MTKPLLYFFIAAGIFLSGCGESLNLVESDYTIKITGTNNLKFKGNYSFPGFNSIGIPLNIEGAVPAEYKGRGVTALCMFRKSEALGTLKVEIFKDKTIVAEKETVDQFGIITLGKPLELNSTIDIVIEKIMNFLRM